jgi:hypothetical protein
MISSCDLAMWIGDGTAQFRGKDGNGNGTFNGSVGNQAQWIRGTTTLHFRGQSILRQSIAKLASLGMSKATRILVTGFVWSGTGLMFHADMIGELLTTASPSLKAYKVLPVDSVHPKFMTMMCTTDVMQNTCNSSSAVPPDCDEVAHQGPKCARIPNYDGKHYIGTWVDTAQAELWNITSSTTPTAPSKACQGAQCMWFNNSAPTVKADMFIVQGMPGVWDTHCAYEASGVGCVWRRHCLYPLSPSQHTLMPWCPAALDRFQTW